MNTQLTDIKLNATPDKTVRRANRHHGAVCRSYLDRERHRSGSLARASTPGTGGTSRASSAATAAALAALRAEIRRLSPGRHFSYTSPDSWLVYHTSYATCAPGSPYGQPQKQRLGFPGSCKDLGTTRCTTS